MKIAGFVWDENNWPKCGKHGVSQREIEEVLTGTPAVMADPYPNEPRLRAIGRTTAGRYVFLVFMRRQIDGDTWLRPISARSSLSNLTDRREGKPVGVSFFGLLRRIAPLFNEEERESWPNPAFPQ